MKKLLIKLIVGLMTFVIGVSAYLVWYRFKPLSLQDVQKHHLIYTFGEVHVRAIFVRTGDSIIAMSFLAEDGAWIELTADEIRNFPLPESTYSRDRIGERIYYMDAVIVGQVDRHIGMGCFGPKYGIKNVRVERVISIHEFDDIDKAREWAKSNSY